MQDQSPTKRRIVWTGIAVALIVGLLYLPTLGFALLNWDDDIFILNNDAVRSPAGLEVIWSSLELPPEFPNYPLTFTSFWLEHRLWGTWPAGFHATNLVLHALNAGLVFSLMSAFGLPLWAAALAALLFGVHPAQVESVAWVSERKNLLSCGFALLALLGYWRVREAGQGAASQPQARRQYLLALVAFGAALLSKTAVVTLPLSLLLLDRCRDGRWTRQSFARIAPFLVLSALAAGATMHVENTPFELPLILRPLLAAANLLFYAVTFLLPWRLMPIYPRWQPTVSLVWCMPLLVVMTMLMVVRRARDWRLQWGVAHFALLLLPTLGLRAYGFNEYSFVADRNLYFASLGLCLVLGLAVATWRARSVAPVAILSTLVVVCLSAVSLAQMHIWRDSLTLWSSVLQRNPQAAVAHANLGWTLIQAGQLPQAEAELQLAVAASPQNPGVHNNLALIALRRGDLQSAEQHSRRAVELKPQDAEFHKNLAVLLLARGRPTDATAEIRQALLLDDRPAYHVILGDSLAAGQQLAAALSEYESAVRRDPTQYRGRYELGRTLLAVGRASAAIDVLQQLVVEVPQLKEARFQLAAGLENAGQREAAVAQLQAVLEIDGNFEPARAALQRLVPASESPPAPRRQ